jgi:putative radical SAM enzyme (TIGR03279 family)
VIVPDTPADEPRQSPAKGLLLQAVNTGSSLARLGLRAGDRLVAIDGLVPRDVIDLQLDLPSARQLTIERAEGSRRQIDVDLRTAAAPNSLDASALTLDEAVPGGIRECNNHCEFCFIRGLPGGLRPSLYIFDDDYRYSFLWGNFLTLTNLDESDWARIGYQRLSPLNVSVHATDADVRRRLLVNKHAPDILPQLERLASLGIKVNAQVVLCAGINDGTILNQTIEELAALYPAVQTLSVVPVGLTRHSRVKNIRRPTAAEALVAVEQCEAWKATLRTRLGVGFVYPSDELLVLAGRQEVPSAADYDGFPVLSNGVGLLRSMLDEWLQLLSRRSTKRPKPRSVAWVTGRLAAPALERMADAWFARTGWRPAVCVADNTYFGTQVTVSGLLSGADLMRALHSLPDDVQDIVLPRGPFGFDGHCTLDGVSAEEVGAAHPGRVHLASTPRELLAILSR